MLNCWCVTYQIDLERLTSSARETISKGHYLGLFSPQIGSKIITHRNPKPSKVPFFNPCICTWEPAATRWKLRGVSALEEPFSMHSSVKTESLTTQKWKSFNVRAVNKRRRRYFLLDRYGKIWAPVGNTRCTSFNLLTLNVNYSGRTASLTSKVAFYIFIQQIYVLNILNMVYTLRFFLFKMQFVS